MASLETRYSVGDTVWFAGSTTERKQHPCPDCLGSRKWRATSPAGGEFDFGCPRCTANYHGDRYLSLDYTVHAPRVQRLTIGSVGIDTDYNTGLPRPKYMCRETGVGSGSVYSEDDLFPTEEDAHRIATTRAKLMNADPEGWVAKQYHRSLRVCDYQLQNAIVEKARGEETRLQSRLRSLFGDIESAESIDDVRAAVEQSRGEPA